MKLKTKLIPLASIGAVCAAVTPLALTSCGRDKFVDLMDMYTPDFDKVQSTESSLDLDEETVLNTWYEGMSANPDRIAQENYWSESRNIQVINSRLYINDVSPEFAYKRLAEVNPGQSTEITKVEFKKQLISNQINAVQDYVFSNISNITHYSEYREKMTNLDIYSQDFTFKYGEGQSQTWHIPTISFTLEYDRTYNMGYNGIVANRAFISKSQAFGINATRENIGKLVIKDLPVLIVDLLDQSGQQCWTVVPFLQWGCEPTDDEFTGYKEWLGYKNITLETVKPSKSWSITSEFTNKQVGRYESDTNGFDINFEAHVTEELALIDMSIKYPSITRMTTYNYLMENGLFASWYVHNTTHKTWKNWLWDLNFFYNK